jgi:hypothetical protein
VHRPAAFIVTLVAQPGVDGIKALRALLKPAKRRFGLIAVDAREIHHDERNQGEISTMDILSDGQTPS